jgi:GDP-mannose 6-dehydrogenase
MGCLARKGHRMIGVDPHASKVDFLNQGRPTIIERDIDQLIAEQHAAGRIVATQDAAKAVVETDVSFICVGTPPTPNGHLDLTAIRHVSTQIGKALANKAARHVIALRSTVLPGTGQMISELIATASGKVAGEHFAVVSNPEFLREGTSIADFENPPFTLVGSAHPWSIDVMKEVYSGLTAPFHTTEPRVAELMKYACNSFHALKITFANEVGNICRKLGIDAHQLMEIFCLDTKLNISKAYLKPGFAYGGSCLPKDLRALRTIAHDHYLESPVLDAIERSNEHQKELVCKEIISRGRQKIGILGLSFKTGTDDLRESPIVDVLEKLLGKGFEIRVFDKHVHIARLTGANKDFILQRIPFISRFVTDNIEQVISNSELIVVVNNEPELQAKLLKLATNKEIYDLAGTGFDQVRKK